MKKILLFLATVALASCSDNDGPSNNYSSDATLVSTLVQTSGDGTQTTTTYRYSDNQLIEINNPSISQKTIFTYSNNMPTEINTYLNGTLFQKTVIGYSANSQLNQQLVYRFTATGTLASKYTYTYSGDTVAIGNYQITADGTESLLSTATFYLSSTGNILRKVYGTNNYTTYSYDGNKAPLSEINAAQILRLVLMDGGINNVLTAQKTESGTTTNTYSTYTYNSDGFPVTENYTTASGEVITRRYTYN